MIGERELSDWARRAFGEDFRMRAWRCTGGHTHLRILKVHHNGRVSEIAQSAARDWFGAARRIECRLLVERLFGVSPGLTTTWKPVYLSSDEQDEVRREVTMAVLSTDGDAQAAWQRFMRDHEAVARVFNEVGGASIDFWTGACLRGLATRR